MACVRSKRAVRVEASLPITLTPSHTHASLTYTLSHAPNPHKQVHTGGNLGSNVRHSSGQLHCL